jgi:hypothetical protein
MNDEHRSEADRMNFVPQHRRSLMGAFGLIISGCAAAGVLTSAVAAPSAHVAANAPLVGIGVHALNADMSQAQIVDLLARSGVNAVRDDAQWRFVETAKGNYQIPRAWDSFVDAVNARSIKPVLILDYGNQLYDGGDKPRSPEAIEAFVRYAAFVVKHFTGRVKYYEVWNEWDNTTGGFPAATPEDYARLFDQVYPALKRVDPSAVILLGAGIQKPQYYEGLARLGVVARADGIAIHPYNYDPIFGPETSADFLMQLEQRLVALSGRPGIDMYVTEIGWPTHVGHGMYPESREAEYAYRTVMLLSALPFIKGIWWYDLKDDGQDPANKEHHYGMFHFDASDKPALAWFNEAATYALAHRLTLDDQTNLSLGRVVLDAATSDGSKSKIGWNFHDSKPLLYARCASGKNPAIDTDSKDSGTEVHGMTLADIRYGNCSVRSLPMGSVLAR